MRRRRPSAAVLVAGVAAVLAGCGPAGSSPPVLTLSPSASSPASHGPTAAQLRAVARWERTGRPRLQRIVALERTAVAAARRNDPYAEVTACQPLQEDIERAQEAAGVPVHRLDVTYQHGLATLAIGTTHCLNDAHSDDQPDRAATIRIGVGGLDQLAGFERSLASFRR